MRAVELLALLTVLVPTGALAIVGRSSGLERRSHFALRLVLVSLALPTVLGLLVVAAVLHVLPDQVAGALFLLVTFMCVPALMLVPSLLFRNPGSGPDGEDDGGSGRRPPPNAPTSPRGDLPLPTCEPGRWRVRDHNRPDLRRVPRHVPARERTLR